MAMDHPRASSLVASCLPPRHEASSQGSQGPTRLRKKLQKSSWLQKGNSLVRRPGSGASQHDESIENTPAGANKLVVSQARPSPPPLSIPPPDLNDSKWADYLRRSGLLCALEQSPAQPKDTPSNANNKNKSSLEKGASLEPPRIVSELSHLVIADDARSKRPSMDDQHRGSPDSPTCSNSSGRMRRRAKTPVLAIGQLEHASAKEPPELPQIPHQFQHKKMQSVEMLAEEYRALLHSRNSTMTDSHSEPPPSRQEDREVHKLRRQHSSDALPRVHITPDPAELPPPLDNLCSPAATSDDGTLVSFEEETIYFKPMSFSPEAPGSPEPEQPFSPDYHNHEHHHVPLPVLSSPLQSPTQRYSAAVASPPVPDSLSLQICLDLLTRELYSAARGRRPSYRRSAAEVSSLQVWVMIEAYERLRDQLLYTDASGEGHRLFPTEELRRPVEIMFDLWLRALYAIHDALAYDTEDERPSSGSDLDLDIALQSEDLD